MGNRIANNRHALQLTASRYHSSLWQYANVPRTDFSVSNWVDVTAEVKVTKHDSMDYTVFGCTYAAPCATVSGTLEAGKK